MPYQGKVTVLIPAFYHRSNVVRCLDAWRRQTRKPDQLIFINDGGNEDIELLSSETMFDLSRPTFIWRTINMAVRAAWPLIEHDYIVLCTSDLIFTSFALEQMLETQVDDCRCSATVYSLNRALSARLDEVPWKETECDFFMQEPGLMHWANQFKGLNSESPGWKAHILFNGNTRGGWERFDPLAFPADEMVGGDECWLRRVEVDAGRPIITLPYPVFHQWHPDRIRWSDEYDPTFELPNDLIPEGEQEEVSLRIQNIRHSKLNPTQYET